MLRYEIVKEIKAKIDPFSHKKVLKSYYFILLIAKYLHGINNPIEIVEVYQ